MKTAVVYWSGTGNTEAMAQAVANGAKPGSDSTGTANAGKFIPVSGTAVPEASPS